MSSVVDLLRARDRRERAAKAAHTEALCNLLTPFDRATTISVLLESLAAAERLRLLALNERANAETLLFAAPSNIEVIHRAETARQRYREAENARQAIIDGLLEARGLES